MTIFFLTYRLTQGANYSFHLELPPAIGQFHPPPHLILPWNSQWLRGIEAAYEMIANDKDSDELVNDLPGEYTNWKFCANWKLSILTS